MMAKTSLAIAAAGAFILALGTAGVAQAGDKHWRGGHKHHYHHHYHGGPKHVHVHHYPAYYAAPVYVAPAPVMVAPPVYAVPSRPVVSFGAVIPLR